MKDMGGSISLQYADAGFGITDVEFYLGQTMVILCYSASIRQVAGDDLADGWVTERATNQVPSDKPGCAGDEQAARNELSFGRQGLMETDEF